eukprot:814514-Ditylum_brightwellii.AAC.1
MMAIESSEGRKQRGAANAAHGWQQCMGPKAVGGGGHLDRGTHGGSTSGHWDGPQRGCDPPQVRTRQGAAGNNDRGNGGALEAVDGQYGGRSASGPPTTSVLALGSLPEKAA